MFKKIILITLLLPLLFACSAENLYKKNITGKFTDYNFRYWKNHYPIAFDVKGVADETMRMSAIAVLMEHLKDHNRLTEAELVSAATYEGEDGHEVQFIVHLNSDPLKSGREICTNQVPLFNPNGSSQNINYVNIGLCRAGETVSYVSASFDMPIDLSSDAFKTMIRRSAHAILNKPKRRKNNTCSNTMMIC